jgi:putative oxygen-independent coproporphyrinogen III oxidase
MPTLTAPTSARTTDTAAPRGFGLYVHWPFCKSKCPYCDFNSHVRDSIDQARWRAGLLRELDHYARETPGRTLTSIFFGGGTPSLMEPATTAAIIDRAAQRWNFAPDIEITLEANPNSIEQKNFTGYRATGINRVSLGVQSLDDASLKFLGRGHNAGEARTAIALAAKTFDRFSFDLIYARPEQTVAQWRAEMKEALTLAGEHLSVYQLTIEPGTQFHTLYARNALHLPPEESAEDLYDATHDVLGAAGLPAYEISNHARPGAACRHNLVYWRYEDYIGIGPGAHGRLTLGGAKIATRQQKAPETWLTAVEKDGHATAERDPIAAERAAHEALVMGLRLSEGLDPHRFARETGRALDDSLDAARLTRLIDGGFIKRNSAGGIVATPAGRKVLNAVLGELVG